MPNIFKNDSVVIGITDTDIYTCPAVTQAVVFGLIISNTEGIEPVNVSVKVYDSSGTVLRTISGLGTPIPVGSALDMGKVVLEDGDVLRAIASKANALGAWVNVLEIN